MILKKAFFIFISFILIIFILSVNKADPPPKENFARELADDVGVDFKQDFGSIDKNIARIETFDPRNRNKNALKSKEAKYLDGLLRKFGPQNYQINDERLLLNFGSKIAIEVTLISSLNNPKFKDLYLALLSNKIFYSSRWRYDLIFQFKSKDVKRAPAWSKILVLKEHLPNYDWIIQLDADSIIKNTGVRFEEIIEQYSEENSKVILYSVDKLKNINTGIMALKNDKRTFEMLDYVYSQTQYLHDGWWENRSFIHWIRNCQDKCTDYTAEVPYLEWNYYQTDKFCFIYHAAGCRDRECQNSLKSSFLDFCFHNFRVDASKDGSFLSLPHRYSHINLGVYESDNIDFNSLVVLLHTRILLHGK